MLQRQESMNLLPGLPVSNEQRAPKRKKTFAKPLKRTKTFRDNKQDKEIKLIKKQLRILAPPVKSRYGENTINPENVWEAVGLPYPAKGGDNDERLGAEIIVKSINFRYNLSVSESDDFDTMRVIIVQYMDGNTNGNYPLNHDTNLWLSPTTAFPYNSPFNTQSADTYRVLFDKVYNLNAAGQAQIAENILITSKDMAISKLKFDGDDGLGLPPLDRGLILMWVCSDSSASPNPKMDVSIKFNFTDT